MSDPSTTPHKRRRRYPGKYPRRFEDKYKERDPQKFSDTIAKVIASGKTPAGSHRPILVDEVIEALTPAPGNLAVDATLGYGGHATQILDRIQPGGILIGLDADPIQLPRTEARLRQLGYGPDRFIAVRSNFAGLPQVLANRVQSPESPDTHRADLILADLGMSSMQIDDPARGFSIKHEGPLDMRFNPARGEPASVYLARLTPEKLRSILDENADEPRLDELAPALAGKLFPTTTALARAVRAALPNIGRDELDLSVRRVFQALRIAVNDEFSALETFLRFAPGCLKPGGRLVVLTFHSGEDRRVKKAFEAGFRDGVYSDISRNVIRPGAEERRANPRSAPAKLRWARSATA